MMRTIRPAFLGGCLAASVLALCPPSPGVAAEPTEGRTLHEACGGEGLPACLAYLAGVIDLHDEALAPQTGPMFCAPDTIAFKEIAEGIWRWYEENPAFLSLPAVYGVTKALGLMYPCE